MLFRSGFTLFTSAVAEAIGFHENRANVLIVEDEKFAGLVSEPILGKEAKLASLLELREKHGLKPAETMAVGDGANDLQMLKKAGLGIAFNAKPLTKALVGTSITRKSMDSILYLLGITDRELDEMGIR